MLLVAPFASMAPKRRRKRAAGGRGKRGILSKVLEWRGLSQTEDEIRCNLRARGYKAPRINELLRTTRPPEGAPSEPAAGVAAMPEVDASRGPMRRPKRRLLGKQTPKKRQAAARFFDLEAGCGDAGAHDDASANHDVDSSGNVCDLLSYEPEAAGDEEPLPPRFKESDSDLDVVEFLSDFVARKGRPAIKQRPRGKRPVASDDDVEMIVVKMGDEPDLRR